MNKTSSMSLDKIPGEAFLMDCLQREVSFSLNGKLIRKGKLLLFKRFNFFIQLCLMSEKKQRETFDIPIPFDVEYHDDDNLMFFDYRIKSLKCDVVPHTLNKSPSFYLDKILEMSVTD